MEYTGRLSERINLGYSLKNIPIPGNQHYLKCLLDKLNSFIRRLRWKVFYFDNQSDSDVAEDNRNTYGFKSERTPPPQCSDLTGFDLYQMARLVKFRRVLNPFQAQLAKDTNAINRSTTLYVPADKNTNLYKIEVKDYEKLLHDNIIITHQKASRDTARIINMEAKHIAEQLKLDDRIEQAAEQKAFITLKDPKPNFPNNIKCRLINPAKSNRLRVQR